MSAILLTGLLLSVAAIIVSLPTRHANWTIRRGDLEVERQRVRDELALRLEELRAAERDEAVERHGTGSSAVILGSREKYQDEAIEAKYNRTRKELQDEAAREELSIDKELEANWWTHMFATRCQGGHQPTIADALPKQRNK